MKGHCATLVFNLNVPKGHFGKFDAPAHMGIDVPFTELGTKN